MDQDDMKMILSMFNEINSRLRTLQQDQYNRLRINQIIDITDDRVHMAKQIVHCYDTPGGVVVHIK